MNFGMDEMLYADTEAMTDASSKSLKYGCLSILKLLIIPVLLLLMAGSGYMLWKAPSGSFGEAIWSEITLGIGFFLLAPLVLKLGQRYKWRAVVGCVLLAFVLAVVAFFLKDLPQALLLSTAGGVMLLGLLDLLIENFASNRITKEMRKISAELNNNQIVQHYLEKQRKKTAS